MCNLILNQLILYNTGIRVRKTRLPVHVFFLSGTVFPENTPFANHVIA